MSNSDSKTSDGFPPGFTRRDEANAIVAKVFRNGPLEDLHAGKASPLLEDPGLSRITQDEMRTLMLYACRRLEQLLRWRESDPARYRQEILFFSQYCSKWER